MSVFTTLRILLIGSLFVLPPALHAQFTGGPGNGTGSGTFSSSAVALPLTLLSFDGHYHAGRVALDWATVDERHTAFFTVERSADGGATFTPVVTVAAAGTTAPGLRSDYAAHDAAPAAGTSYYRLRMVDIDGSQRYSDVVGVVTETALADVGIFPNPAAGGRTRLALSEDWARTPVVVFVYDQRGREVYRTAAPAGPSLALHPARPLPAGAYVVRLLGDNGRQLSRRLTVSP